MNRLDAASDHHRGGFTVDIAAGTPGLPPLFQKRNPTHVVALKGKNAEKVASWKSISSGIHAGD